jgi:SPRY domain
VCRVGLCVVRRLVSSNRKENTGAGEHLSWRALYTLSFHVYSPCEMKGSSNNSKRCSIREVQHHRPSLIDLPDDVQLRILQCLDIATICCSVRFVHERYRDLLHVTEKREKDVVVEVNSAASTTTNENVGNVKFGTQCPAATSATETALWKPLCRTLWPWLGDEKFGSASIVSLSLSRTIRTSVSRSDDDDDVDGASHSTPSPPPLLPDYATLLTVAMMAGTTYMEMPQIDDTLWNSDDDNTGPAAAAAAAVLGQRRPLPPPLPRHALFTRSASDSSVVQYMGIVGTGNRCLLGSTPLPRPRPACYSDPTHRHGSSNHHGVENDKDNGAIALRNRNRLMGLHLRIVPARPRRRSVPTLLPRALRQKWARSLVGTLPCASASGSTNESAIWIPMVVPFYAHSSSSNGNSSNDSSRTKVAILDLTPRFISYFEVSILPTELCRLGDPRVIASQLSNRNGEELGCVAVGLATARFKESHLDRRIMPGWDTQSFGYHGDDGGLYHGSGRMLHPPSRPFPRFGAPGDVIGCGIDYHRQVIFYTLNGQWLGAAFNLRGTALIQATVPLYPVIGVDTNRPIRCNFGTEADHPFSFDLGGLIRSDHDVLVQAVRAASTAACRQVADTATASTSSSRMNNATGSTTRQVFSRPLRPMRFRQRVVSSSQSGHGNRRIEI